MPELPKKLRQKLAQREEVNALRDLPCAHNLVDFSSNDYLGLAKNKNVFLTASELLAKQHSTYNGATGSRLLSGNHRFYRELETFLKAFHQVDEALVFNSGYDANIALFSSVPQRDDLVFYDELIHASIRDGIKMGNAKSYKFKHNNIEDLKSKCRAQRSRGLNNTVVYIVTETVFSMDGDIPHLKALAEFCKKNECNLIVDEAHAIGVFGQKGNGLVQEYGLQDAVLARIVTFGKALGCHGAAILGTKELKSYLINFARSFIYTTALPPHSVATTLAAYNFMKSSQGEGHLKKLRHIINLFQKRLEEMDLQAYFIPSDSAIHSCIIGGNDRTKSISHKLQGEGYDVKPILSPTVTKGSERLRFCLHSYNTQGEITGVLRQLKMYLC